MYCKPQRSLSYLSHHQIDHQLIGEAVEVSPEPLFRYGAGNFDIDAHLRIIASLSP